MKIKMKNGSHRYDINRHKSRHGYKYSENKKCVSMMILTCIRQHLSNIWSSIHEKNEKNHKKKKKKKNVAYKQKACIIIGYFFSRVEKTHNFKDLFWCSLIIYREGMSTVLLPALYAK